LLTKTVSRFILPFSVSALLVAGCGSKESAFLEIDYSGASGWKYLLGADIYGTPLQGLAGSADTNDSGETFSGSLRAYLQGLPPEPEAGAAPGPARFALTDVTFNAPFFSDEEREDIYKRLTELRIDVSETNVALSDTIGIPGVMTGGWDIIRCITRVMPVMPNAELRVGTSWEREQRFPLTVDDGPADGVLYQLFTLDSLSKTETGAPFAALSWVFTYRVSLQGDGGAASKKYPLLGSGRGTAELDLNRKQLLKAKAAFQVTHSQKTDTELNEIVHFEMVE
jgi:hypothetical protein